MKTYTPYSLLLAAVAASGMAFGAETAYTTPVGYLTIPIPGTGGAGSQKIQIANQGLLPSGAVQFSGVAESFGTDGTGTFLQDDQGTWAAGAYVTAGTTGTLVSHLVEITSGPLQGSMSWVTSAAANKLYTSDNLSAAGTNVSFRVLKAFTVSTLFGAVPDPLVLGGAGTITAADTVQILEPLGTPLTLWYKSTGGAASSWGWKASGLPAGIDAADVAKLAIHPNDGLLIYRKQSGDGKLVVSGDVKLGNTKVRIEGGTGSVYNVIANQIPVDKLTISATGLYTGDPLTGIKGGGTLTAADTVQIWNPATGAFTSFWYKNAGGAASSWGWKSTDASIVDPANYVIPSTNSIMIERKSGTVFSWNIPAAYTPAP